MDLISNCNVGNVYTDIKVYNTPSFWSISKRSRLNNSLLKIFIVDPSGQLTYFLHSVLTNQWVSGLIIFVSGTTAPPWSGSSRGRSEQFWSADSARSFLKVNFIFISWWSRLRFRSRDRDRRPVFFISPAGSDQLHQDLDGHGPNLWQEVGGLDVRN